MAGKKITNKEKPTFPKKELEEEVEKTVEVEKKSVRVIVVGNDTLICVDDKNNGISVPRSSFKRAKIGDMIKI